MPTISQEKRDKISEQILSYLFSVAPQSMFTVDIAKSIARDEEFTKSILSELKLKSVVVEVNKNASGKQYIRRQRWRLSNQAYEAYQKHQ
jgi:hypothetical protein